MISLKSPVQKFLAGLCAVFCLWTAYLLAQERPQVARPHQPRVIVRPQIGALPPTFNKEVVRILQAGCQNCHHEGGIGPYALMTYADTFPHKNDIVFQTASRKMPPWHVDSACNNFQSDPSLSSSDKATLAAWVAAGAPEGNPADLPAPLTFPAAWSLGDPDMTLAMPETYKPNFNQGDVYRCFVLPTGLTDDRFVRAVEILPGARKMVHHVILYVDTSGQAQALDNADPGPGYTCFGGPGFSVSATSPSLGGWAPGNQPRFLPDGLGMSLPKGASVVMQVHYSAHNGIGVSDQSAVGIYFTRAPVQKRVLIAPVVNTGFYIPAGAPDYEVTASIAFLPFDAHLIAVTPHMHLLGTTMHVKSRTLGGVETCLADVPQWDFNWQATYTYKNAVAAPFGTSLSLSAHYDNSQDNVRNPNSPPKGIGWGENTTDEMCIGFLNFTLDAENLTSSAAASPERAGQLEAVEPFLRELWSQLDPALRPSSARR